MLLSHKNHTFKLNNLTCYHHNSAIKLLLVVGASGGTPHPKFKDHLKMNRLSVNKAAN